MNKQNMIENTWQELKERSAISPLVILPVGSIEQHGCHAPLGTDLMIAEATAASLSGERILRLPAIPVGVSEYHRDFYGSLWVSPEVLKQYVGSIVKSLHYHGLNDVLIVNGHGGNREPLREMARYLELEGEYHVYVWTWFEAIEPKIIQMFGRRPPLHADEAETAMLMAVDESVVRRDKFQESTKGSSPVWGKFFGGTLVSQVVKNFSSSGATGDPTKTDLEKGKLMLRWSLENLKEFADYIFSEMDQRSKKG